MRNLETGFHQGGAAVGGGLPSGVRAMIALAPRVSTPGFSMAFSRDEEIFGEEEEADFVYKVIEGVVRTCRMLSDGRRQIVAFYYPGDVFGLDAGEVHDCCAEAVTNCQVALSKRVSVERAADQDNGVARDLWALARRDLNRMSEHMLLLSRKGATERVAAFLLQQTRRADSRTVELAMSRIDIADFLGLTIESVSRSMTQLERERTIALPTARRVEVRDLAALEDHVA